MGSGIAGKRRLPRQGSDKDAAEDDGIQLGDRPPSQRLNGHPTDLISPQPLSYEERSERWLRANGTLWRAEPERAEWQPI